MADTPHSPVVFDLAEEAATARLAGRVAALAEPRDVISLSGDLGSGKTVFARAFINARTETPEEVPSPTFTLVQGYEFPDPKGAIPVYHFDLYRIEDESELEELGLDDAFADGISLIEWPDRLGGRMNSLLAGNRLDVVLSQGQTPEQRRAELSGHGSWRARLKALAEKESGDV